MSLAGGVSVVGLWKKRTVDPESYLIHDPTITVLIIIRRVSACTHDHGLTPPHVGFARAAPVRSPHGVALP